MNQQETFIANQILHDTSGPQNSTLRTIATACSELCNVFCWPPFPNTILAKIILRPPPQTYDFYRENDPIEDLHNRIQNVLSEDLPDNCDSNNSDTETTEIMTVQPASSTTCLVGCRKSSKNTENQLPCQFYKMKIDIDEIIDPFPINFNTESQIDAFYVNSEVDSAKIPCVFIRCKEGEKQPFVLLYAHGNGVDIGEMTGTLAIYSQEFQVDVICYDYRGYGLADGWAVEKYLHSDALSVFNFIKSSESTFNYKNENIILYGQSIGSVPTSKLASLTEAQGIVGVVLHSPLASAAHFLKLGPKLHKAMVTCFNPYANIDCCDKINALTLVIHGNEDEVVGFEQGVALFDKLTNPFKPMWIDGGEHNDLEDFPQFLPHLSMFFYKVKSL